MLFYIPEIIKLSVKQKGSNPITSAKTKRYLFFKIIRLQEYYY
jgi:hypothetical protein